MARICEGIQNLIAVKLDYLSLNRSLETLSGGEAQRLKLARELGNNLIEMVYILDEPTSGLHLRDRENIIKILRNLKDSHNSVIVIEHNEEIIRNADYLLELGPGAGKRGGEIVAKGGMDDILGSPKSLTAKYLKTRKVETSPRRKPSGYLEVNNAQVNNLKQISCKIPLGVLCVFTGVSGSGKSSLLVEVVARQHSDRVVVIDQNPLQGSSRGNSAIYIGVFDIIRDLVARENKVSKSLFSFNGKGACPDCKGPLGYKKIDMHFMGDVNVKCETCLGKRYKSKILDYKYRDNNIDDILKMTIEEAFGFFDEPKIRHKLETLISVGLGYIELGQSHDTFSGGEAQRLKLTSQLQKKGEVYILDEPTSGLHFADIENLPAIPAQSINPQP